MNIKLFLLSALSISIYTTEAAFLSSMRNGALQPRALLRSLMNGQIANGLRVHCESNGTIIKCSNIRPFNHATDALPIELKQHLIRRDIYNPLTGEATGALIIGSDYPHLLRQEDINAYACRHVEALEDSLTERHIERFQSGSNDTSYLPEGFLTEHFGAELFETRFDYDKPAAYSFWPHSIGTKADRTKISRKSLIVYSLVNAQLRSLWSPLEYALIIRATKSPSNNLLLENGGDAKDNLMPDDLQEIAMNNFAFVPQSLPVFRTDMVVVGPAATQATDDMLEMATYSSEKDIVEYGANGKVVGWKSPREYGWRIYSCSQSYKI